MTGSFHISLFEGTLHVYKIHVCFHSRPQSPSFLGNVVGFQIKPSGSGDENGVIQNRKHSACATRSSLPTDRSHTETCGRFAFT